MKYEPISSRFVSIASSFFVKVSHQPVTCNRRSLLARSAGLFSQNAKFLSSESKPFRHRKICVRGRLAERVGFCRSYGIQLRFLEGTLLLYRL
jgi:hypothetical protein